MMRHQQTDQTTMEITKATRRIVTSHDPDGKAVAIFDGPVVSLQRSPGGNAVTMLWVTAESPAELSESTDRAETKVGVPPPIDHHAMLLGMGIDPASQGYSRHPNTHRTRSIDYAIVLEGEIDMLMDDAEVHMTAGDVLIQQGTNHAWVNNGTRPCRIAFVLIDSEAPAAWKKKWPK
jgi:mannose-6-phosphate isomerase-like protein (cupin superfamily)